jgi:peroxiredoxin
MVVKPLLAALLLAIAAGAVAPDFTLQDQDRKPVTLAAARGHKAVLVFYRGYW